MALYLGGERRDVSTEHYTNKNIDEYSEIFNRGKYWNWHPIGIKILAKGGHNCFYNFSSQRFKCRRCDCEFAFDPFAIDIFPSVYYNVTNDKYNDTFTCIESIIREII